MSKELNPAELVQAMRACQIRPNGHPDCSACPFDDSDQCYDDLFTMAADTIENFMRSIPDLTFYAVVGGNTDSGEGTIEGIYPTRRLAQIGIESSVNNMLNQFVQDYGDDVPPTDYDHGIFEGWGYASDGATTYNFRIDEIKMVPIEAGGMACR